MFKAQWSLYCFDNEEIRALLTEYTSFILITQNRAIIALNSNRKTVLALVLSSKGMILFS
jgi:hypothetical protein